MYTLPQFPCSLSLRKTCSIFDLSNHSIFVSIACLCQAEHGAWNILFTPTWEILKSHYHPDSWLHLIKGLYLWQPHPPHLTVWTSSPFICPLVICSQPSVCRSESLLSITLCEASCRGFYVNSLLIFWMVLWGGPCGYHPSMQMSKQTLEGHFLRSGGFEKQTGLIS